MDDSIETRRRPVDPSASHAIRQELALRSQIKFALKPSPWWRLSTSDMLEISGPRQALDEAEAVIRELEAEASADRQW